MTTFQNLQIDDQLPDFRAIDFKPVEKKYFKIILFNWSIITGILLGVYSLIYLVSAGGMPTIVFITGLSIIAVIILAILVYLRVSFKKRQFAVREHDISYRSGLLFHTITTVPFSRIQHIEIGEGPMERLFKLASINIFTAGDNGRDLRIKGLTHEGSQKIKAFITTQLNG